MKRIRKNGDERMSISIVIPVLNESDKINDHLDHLKDIFKKSVFEIIVVDCDDQGSTINAIKASDNINIIKLISRKGRAIQMNRGAAESASDLILFLHADTYLPDCAEPEIESVFSDKDIVAAAFDFTFDVKSFGLNIISFFGRLRTRISRIPFGDQAICIRREYFKNIGGYKEISLMEDVELLKRIRNRGDKIFISKLRVTTSARKYINEGLLNNTIRNWRNQILYNFGWNPEKLVKYYYRNNNKNK